MDLLLWGLWGPPVLYAIWSVWFIREVWRMDREQIEAGFPPGLLGAQLLGIHRLARLRAEEAMSAERQAILKGLRLEVSDGL